MRTTGFAVMLLLSLMTGTVIGQLHDLDASTAQRLSAKSDGGSLAVAQKFYDAINETLATGNAHALASILHPRYQDWVITPDQPLRAPAFIDQIRAVRHVFPEYRIRCSALLADGNDVLAHISPDGDPGGTFAGLAVEAPHWWDGLELLRISDGRVIQRAWNSGSSALLTMVADIEMPSTDARQLLSQVSVFELTRANSALELPASDLTVVMVSGSVVDFELLQTAGDPAFTYGARNSGQGPQQQVWAGSRTAIAGSAVIDLPAESRFRLNLTGPGIANVTVLTLLEQKSSSFMSMSPAINIDPDSPGSTTLRLSIGFARLTGGDSIPEQDLEQSVLVSAVQGALETSVHAGTAMASEAGLWSVQSGPLTVRSGCVQSAPGSRVSYAAADGEPASAWFVAIRSA